LAQGIDVPLPTGYDDLVLQVFGKRCARCGTDHGIELDHHQPLGEGYPLLHNAVPLCKSCNRRKHAKPPEEFYDSWKLAEIAVLLWETREEFDRRFAGDIAS
jgi:hypothetical protein